MVARTRPNGRGVRSSLFWMEPPIPLGTPLRMKTRWEVAQSSLVRISSMVHIGTDRVLWLQRGFGASGLWLVGVRVKLFGQAGGDRVDLDPGNPRMRVHVVGHEADEVSEAERRFEHTTVGETETPQGVIHGADHAGRGVMGVERGGAVHGAVAFASGAAQELRLNYDLEQSRALSRLVTQWKQAAPQ